MSRPLTDYEKTQANKLTDWIIIGTFSLMLFGGSYLLMLRGLHVETVESGGMTAFTINMTWQMEAGGVLLLFTVFAWSVMNGLWKVQYA